jgi:hypothetical protein
MADIAVISVIAFVVSDGGSGFFCMILQGELKQR